MIKNQKTKWKIDKLNQLNQYNWFDHLVLIKTKPNHLIVTPQKFSMLEPTIKQENQLKVSVSIPVRPTSLPWRVVQWWLLVSCQNFPKILVIMTHLMSCGINVRVVLWTRTHNLQKIQKVVKFTGDYDSIVWVVVSLYGSYIDP